MARQEFGRATRLNAGQSRGASPSLTAVPIRLGDKWQPTTLNVLVERVSSVMGSGWRRNDHNLPGPPRRQRSKQKQGPRRNAKAPSALRHFRPCVTVGRPEGAEECYLRSARPVDAPRPVEVVMAVCRHHPSVPPVMMQACQLRPLRLLDALRPEAVLLEVCRRLRLPDERRPEGVLVESYHRRSALPADVPRPVGVEACQRLPIARPAAPVVYQVRPVGTRVWARRHVGRRYSHPWIGWGPLSCHLRLATWVTPGFLGTVSNVNCGPH